MFKNLIVDIAMRISMYKNLTISKTLLNVITKTLTISNDEGNDKSSWKGNLLLKP